MRSKALDITKGLGILFVVFGHNWLALTKDGELVRVIFSFHMPLFFFISGALLNIKTSTIDFVQIRFNSLLKPYFIVLFCVCTADIIGLFINNKDVSARELAIFAKVIYGTGGTIPWVPLWFLPHLFLISVISIIIIKSIEDFSEKYLPLISVLLLCIGFMFLSYFSKHGFSPFGYYIDSPMGLPW
jgi:fucose 4-O-acetylase-like acetyltransferase